MVGSSIRRMISEEEGHALTFRDSARLSNCQPQRQPKTKGMLQSKLAFGLFVFVPNPCLSVTMWRLVHSFETRSPSLDTAMLRNSSGSLQAHVYLFRSENSSHYLAHFATGGAFQNVTFALLLYTLRLQGLSSIFRPHTDAT